MEIKKAVLVLYVLVGELSQESLGQKGDTIPCHEGSKHPNPNDCSKYSNCVHGGFVATSCPGGLHFSVSKNDCDFIVTAGCTLGQSTTMATTTLRPTVTTVVATTTTVPTTTAATTLSISTTTTTVPTTLSTTATTTTVPTTLSTTATTTMVPTTLSTTTTARTTSPPSPPIVPKLICYFTSWSSYRLNGGSFLPSHIPPSLCTHIVYALAFLDSNTSLLTFGDNEKDIKQSYYSQVTSLKQSGVVKVSLAIGGWGNSKDSRFSVLVNDPVKRAAFVNTTIRFLQTYNFDGLDIDWEFPVCWNNDCSMGPATDKPALGSLIKELRVAMPPGMLLSVMVSRHSHIIRQAYEVPTLSGFLDWMAVMDYDFHGFWEMRTGHHSPLYPSAPNDLLSVNGSIATLLELGADPRKLIVGVPFYGQTFTLANVSNNVIGAASIGPGIAGPSTNQPGVLAYYEICSKPWTIVQDSTGRMGPYAFNQTQWVSYDDSASVANKANYIKQRQLGGAMVWSLDLDDFLGNCGAGRFPLLNSLNKALGVIPIIGG